MENKHSIEILENNMVEYRELNTQLKEITNKLDQLKIQNLSLMKSLALETYTYDNLSIKLIKSFKKTGVDENKLIGLIGPDRVNSMKIVPVDAVLSGIKDKTLPEAAKFCILTSPQAEYTMIREVKLPLEKINLSE